MGKMTIQQILMQLAGGMGTSIQIFAVTLIFSLPLGLFVALGRMSKNKLLQAVIKVYISIMRGTPLMLQLLVVYFGPYYIFGMRVGNSYRLWAVFIGFVINYAAYFAEIYRSGIQSMYVCNTHFVNGSSIPASRISLFLGQDGSNTISNVDHILSSCLYHHHDCSSSNHSTGYPLFSSGNHTTIFIV